MKLSSHDNDKLKQRITADVELKFKHSNNQKDSEIENLNDQIFQWKRKLDLINTEYETFKNDALREIDLIRDGHKTEIREYLYKIQLLNEKNDSVDRESYKSMKSELESYRKQFNDFQTEITNLRKEKELIISERNEIRITLLKELDQEKLKSRMMHNDYEKNTTSNKNMETELGNIKTKIEDKNEEIKNLINEKYFLTKELREKENEFEIFKSELRLLRQKISDRDKEFEDNLKFNHEQEKQRFVQERIEKEDYQRKIEELTNNLKQMQIEFKNYHEKAQDELHCAKRDFYIVQEEKRILIKRQSELQQDLEFIRNDYEKKVKSLDVYEKEVSNLQERYRELSNKETENYKIRMNLESFLKQKTEEIENLNNYINILKNEKGGLNDKEKNELYYKIENLEKKKKYYKKKVLFYY